jgi:MoxR-like ATPase
VLSAAAVLDLQRQARALPVAAALLDYVQALVAHTRRELALGLSPRAAQGLLRAAQAWALIAGENVVLPEHVQIVFPAVAAHRLESRQDEASARGRELADALIRAVAVPV